VGVLTGISLFAGAGGLDIAAKWAGIRTVCYVEWDRYAQAVLMSRFRSGELDPAPVWDDVQTFDGRHWRGKVGCVFGGFPCQPHSRAGKRLYAADERNRWPDFLRVVQESRPDFVLGENVPGIFDDPFAYGILADLEREGYCARPISIRACDVGAPIVSERIFFMGHRKEIYTAPKCGGRERVEPARTGTWSLQEFEGLVRRQVELSVPAGSRGRISDGVAFRIHKLRCLGNGVVPQQAYPAFQKIIELAKI
jgi:DNA (cytosine-5)-methyltransferase 1